MYEGSQMISMCKISTTKKREHPRGSNYRASHIILDYLQSLTPKYAHYTQKI